MTDRNEPELAGQLKRILRFLPAPVGVVTSFDPATGEPLGLAMSAIMPVSLEPCAMAVAVNRTGSSHVGFLNSRRFCINLLDPASSDHLAPFGDPARRTERFRTADWKQEGPLWYIEGAPANIFCEVSQLISYGTHDLVIGEVRSLRSSGSTEILGWADGALGRLAPLSA